MKEIITSVAIVSAFLIAAPLDAQKARPSAVIRDAAGTVNEFNGKGNSFDVVEVKLGSDGSHLLVEVTLAAETGTMAGSAVELYIDADNNAKTGGTSEWGPGGFEYVAEVGICLVEDTGRTCTGGADGPIKLRHAATMVERFKGASGEEMGFSTLEMTVSHLMSPETPLNSRILSDRIRYSDLGVKSGSTIRIAVRESDRIEREELFPDVLLKLK